MRTRPGPREFALNAAAYGLPSRDDLIALRIWDIHYHGLMGATSQARGELFYVERMGIERMLALDIVGSGHDPLGTSVSPEKRREIRVYLEKNADRVSGLIPIDPGIRWRAAGRWRNGSAMARAWESSTTAAIPEELSAATPATTRSSAGRRIERADLHPHLVKVGGNPRQSAGATLAGNRRRPTSHCWPGGSPGCRSSAATPAATGSRACEPCVHSTRRLHRVQWLRPPFRTARLYRTPMGASRLVWGGHGPSRSYSTELSKVLDADLTHVAAAADLGGNLRRIATPIFRRKGYSLER